MSLPEAKELSIQPVYPATAGALLPADCGGGAKRTFLLPEQICTPLPDRLREEYHLCTLRYALETIHFPQDPGRAGHRLFRLTFEEFLVLQLGLLRIKSGRKSENLHPIPKASKRLCPAAALPAHGAQRRAITESVEDMASPPPMNRLVQGDVGSGKDSRGRRPFAGR